MTTMPLTTTKTDADFFDGDSENDLFTYRGRSYVYSFLFNWLDLLAFSLSGLKAEGTSCAAMAYVMADLHREGAKLGECFVGL